MSAIVLIEDNANNARLAAKILRLAGHDVMVAEDGTSGLELLQNVTPDLILMDLGLPDIDGQTVVAMIKQEPGLSAVPVIAFTAWPNDTATEMAQAYGCDGIITKPVDTRKFASQVESFLEISASPS